jgi:hypothetical protein
MVHFYLFVGIVAHFPFESPKPSIGVSPQGACYSVRKKYKIFQKTGLYKGVYRFESRSLVIAMLQKSCGQVHGLNEIQITFVFSSHTEASKNIV